MADAVSSTPDGKYFNTELSRLFLAAPPPSAGVVRDEICSCDRKEGLDTVGARANSARRGTGGRPTGNWECHLCAHCPSASILGSGTRQLGSTPLPFHPVWPLGGGGGQPQEMGDGNGERGQGTSSPTPAHLSAPDTPTPSPFQHSWGSVTLSSPLLVPPAPGGGQGSLQGLAPKPSPSCPYLCKEFFHVTSPLSHWGESHFWPEPSMAPTTTQYPSS